MSEENRHNLANDADSDETLVRPFFNDEAAEAARPVVPLSADAVAASDAREENFSPLAPPGAAYASRLRPRGGWPVALVLVSALFGALVGVFALRFYQTRGAAGDVTPQTAAAEQTATATQTDADAPQPAPPVENQAAASESDEQPAAEQPQEEESATDDAETSPDESEAEAARPDAAPRNRTAEETRPSATIAPAAERKDAGTRRRGKRGDDDDDEVQAARTRRVARRAERPREEAGDGRPQPRLVDVITGEPERRRQRRRGRGGGQRDSLRAIFEGQPPG